MREWQLSAPVAAGNHPQGRLYLRDLHGRDDHMPPGRSTPASMMEHRYYDAMHDQILARGVVR
jgi:hypothetical protein